MFLDQRVGGGLHRNYVVWQMFVCVLYARVFMKLSAVCDKVRKVRLSRFFSCTGYNNALAKQKHSFSCVATHFIIPNQLWEGRSARRVLKTEGVLV